MLLIIVDWLDLFFSWKLCVAFQTKKNFIKDKAETWSEEKKQQQPEHECDRDEEKNIIICERVIIYQSWSS